MYLWWSYRVSDYDIDVLYMSFCMRYRPMKLAHYLLVVDLIDCYCILIALILRLYNIVDEY